jgi:hypothetical protein
VPSAARRRISSKAAVWRSPAGVSATLASAWERHSRIRQWRRSLSPELITTVGSRISVCRHVGGVAGGGRRSPEGVASRSRRRSGRRNVGWPVDPSAWDPAVGHGSLRGASELRSQGLWDHRARRIEVKGSGRCWHGDGAERDGERKDSARAVLNAVRHLTAPCWVGSPERTVGCERVKKLAAGICSQLLSVRLCTRWPRPARCRLLDAI